MMEIVLGFVHFACGFIVLAEALNKLERVRPSLSLSLRPRYLLLTWLKAAAWFFVAIGAMAAFITPVALALAPAVAYYVPAPSIGDTAMVFGTAIHVIRTRVKEASIHHIRGHA